MLNLVLIFCWRGRNGPSVPLGEPEAVAVLQPAFAFGNWRRHQRVDELYKGPQALISRLTTIVQERVFTLAVIGSPAAGVAWVLWLCCWLLLLLSSISSESRLRLLNHVGVTVPPPRGERSDDVDTSMQCSFFSGLCRSHRFSTATNLRYFSVV